MFRVSPQAPGLSQAENPLSRGMPFSLGCSFGQHPTALSPWGLQKEQAEEKLHEVHLQQLQVRNAQYQKQIDEKNQELLQLKLTSEKADRVLNSCKVSEPLSALFRLSSVSEGHARPD